MKKMILLLISALYFIGCNTEPQMEELGKKINSIIESKDATFGIGVYDFATQKSIYINGDKEFVMMSVVKFPQAITLLQEVDAGKHSLDEKISFEESDLRPTYSPIMKDKDSKSFDITLGEALSYTVSKSDNNVCDKLFQILGGPQTVENSIRQLGINSIAVGTDYANMPVNGIAANRITPKDLTELFRQFYNREILSDASSDILWKKLVETSTGKDRLKGLLPENTTVGHKTGSSGIDNTGMIHALNDAGIIQLPSGNSIIVVVLGEDSNLGFEATSRVIAEIANVCYDFFDK